MQAEAPVPGEPEANYGFSILDLTKHACLTILETLDESDRLGIVTFGTEARVLQGLVPVDGRGKKASRKKIMGMQVDGITNLWHGIREGLKLFKGESGRVPAMLVSLLLHALPGLIHVACSLKN
jgi:Mg-chelatase subunit ChlD